MTIKGFISSGFLLFCFTLTSTAMHASTRQTLPNLELKALQNAQLIGPINPRHQITFTLWLKLRNKATLDKLINALYDPQSPQYQKFLSAKAFNQNFAPTLNDVQYLQRYFNKMGMQSHRKYNNLQVTATAIQIEKLFQLKINNYHHQNRIVYGNDSAPKIPADIAPYIKGVSGLSNIPYTHSQHRSRPKQNNLHWQAQVLNLLWHTFVPAVIPTTTSLAGFTGAQLRTTYNLANVPPINGTTIDGTGQTIVIIDGCGSATKARIKQLSNLYNQANNLPLLDDNNFVVVKHDGSPYHDSCANPAGWDGEIMLDVQSSHTIAPGANIVLVLTDDVANDQVADAINYILDNHFTIGGFDNAYVVSNSWDNTYENANEPLDDTLETAAAEGMSINFAAGDCGDQTYNSGWTCSSLSATPSVEYPVSSAFVTAVGGTSVFVDNNWNYAFESGWGTLLNGQFYSGSMGGISQYRAAPTWQNAISSFTAGGYSAGTVGQYNKRALPDIAMLADLYTGLLVYSENCSPCYDGGASLATPLFSGTLTLVNQARALLAGGTPNPIGLAAPYLYINNSQLLRTKALNVITPPHRIISGAAPIPNGPDSAFQIVDTFYNNDLVGFNWDSSLTVIESQFWNDVVGVGSPNIPNFVQTMATL